MTVYRRVFTLVLAKLDPELAHRLGIVVIRAAGVAPIGWLIQRWTRPRPSEAVTAFGVRFPTRFGIAAGFDKDAVAIRGLQALGFGHVEVGTVTAHAQAGNPKPRLFRLIAERGVINRMGFNNHGARAAAGRLARAGRRTIVVGANIGKSRIVEVADATADYVRSARMVAPFADYLAVNVSSPNTPGLRGLQAVATLRPLLRAVRDAAGDTPVLVKISPDLPDDEIAEIAALAVEMELAGLIATNTTISRAGVGADPATLAGIGAGGLSGAPLKARSLEVLRLVRAVVPASFAVISVGGVSTRHDVDERIAAGATLVQGYTGFLYQGPLWAMQVREPDRA